MRVLVTGAGGQLGHDVVATCTAVGDELIAPAEAALDVTDRDQVLGTIAHVRPDLVVHCGAFTAVDACESDPDRAWSVNAMGTRHVADGCARSGAFLVHVSTDYVFDGEQHEPYVEWDRPNPRSVYGRSKLGAEQEVQALLPGAAIVRTSWVAGAHGTNVVATVLRLLATDPGREFAFVDDQRGCPTFTADLAPALRAIGAARRPGTFHITNQGATTWYGLVGEILTCAGASPDQARPITTAELDPPRPAPRPANSVLDNAALRLSGLPLLAHHTEPLARLVQELKVS